MLLNQLYSYKATSILHKHIINKSMNNDVLELNIKPNLFEHIHFSNRSMRYNVKLIISNFYCNLTHMFIQIYLMYI